jgi:UDP-N-acetylglucosamine 4,6-dehydratase
VNILVTGGTGSFGQALIRRLLVSAHTERIVVYSRDELKQHDMRTAGLTYDQLRYFIGDVRDLQRLRRAMRGVDVVVHAAALKQVESCEFNPQEAVKTNVYGTGNVIEAALDCDVRKVLMIGTDKAVDPINLYGATKLTAEKLMIDANAYSGSDGPAFSCTRYGNVISSRGAVLPVFQAKHAAGLPLTVTDPTMTRFVLTLNQGVSFVLGCLEKMRGGEVFVPRLKTVTVATIADSVNPAGSRVIVGRRPGEKHDELLISANEPELAARNDLPFPYGSDTDPADRLSVDEFRDLAGLGEKVAA